jgi:arylsulfatase A-like enzyme
MLNRREFLGALGAAAAAPVLAASPARPNLVVILADDMGFSDAGCYGGDVDTPNLDRLAATGLRFTQMYSTARCGPSRNCLMTGYYAQQTACDIMTPGKVPAYTKFVPEYLKPLGYRSYHSGKWHLKFVTGEAGVGFDHSYNMMDELRFFTQKRHELDGELLPVPGPGYYSTTAISDYAVRFLKEHQQKYAAQPFFLYLAPHAPHFPLQAPPEDIAKYKDRFAEGWDTARERKLQRMQRMGLVNCGLARLEPNMWTKWNTPDDILRAKIGPGEVMRAVPWSTLSADQKSFQRTKMAIHAAMISRMDLEIGKVLKQIQAMGAADNTMALFLSDNGASSEQLIRGDGHDSNAPPGSASTHLGLGPGWASCSNAPFRLHKSWVNEGGISSPMIVNWPKAMLAKNQLRHNPAHFVDVLPTLLEVAGAQPDSAPAPNAPTRPGKSLFPVFQRDRTAPHDYIYFNHNNNRAIRMNDWKAVSIGADGPWELYDLSTDRSEQKDRAAVQPEKLKALTETWKRHDDEFVLKRESASPTSKSRLNLNATA